MLLEDSFIMPNVLAKQRDIKYTCSTSWDNKVLVTVSSCWTSYVYFPAYILVDLPQNLAYSTYVPSGSTGNTIICFIILNCKIC